MLPNIPGSKKKKGNNRIDLMFTTEHFIWIGLCAAFIAAMTLLAVKNKWSVKRAGWFMVIICLFSETSKMMLNMLDSTAGGMHLNPKSLPFHLCSLFIFAVIYITFGKESKLRSLVINLVSVMGTMGSFMAILIPTNGTNFATLPAYQCFVYHSGLMWFSMYLLISGEAKLTLRSFVENMGIMAALVLVMLYVNSVLSVYDTNFFYLTRPPLKNLPYLNLDRGWYVYFFRLAFLGAVMAGVFHLPFILVDCKRKTGKRLGVREAK